MYSNLIYLGPESFIALIPRAILEGGLWGAAEGIGTAWTLKSQRSYWIMIPASILACGLTLIATDLILGVVTKRFITDSVLLIGLAGAALPAFIFTAAMIGRRKFH